MPDTTPPAALDAPSATSCDGKAPAEPDDWPGGAGDGSNHGSRDDSAGGLPALRSELDRIDNAIHTLLIERAGVVEQVAQSGKPAAFRPGREAAIIRRLLARHEGKLPGLTICRIWREMLAGTTRMQGPFTIAVGGDGDGLVQLAREHFGALAPIRVQSGAAQALREVRSGGATVAVVPFPGELDAWWTLLSPPAQRLHIVARLPFWAAPRPDGAPAADALVVAAMPPDASGDDRSFLAFAPGDGATRARITAELEAAGLTAEAIMLSPKDGQGLAEITGALTDDDPRLAALGRVLRHPVVVGGYAVPIGGGA